MHSGCKYSSQFECVFCKFLIPVANISLDKLKAQYSFNYAEERRQINVFLNIPAGEYCKIDKYQLSFIQTSLFHNRTHGRTSQRHVVLSSDVRRNRLYKDSMEDAENQKYHPSTSVYIFNAKKVWYVRNQI